MAKPEPYKPPVDQLLRLGEAKSWGVHSMKDWLDYPALGFTASDVPELIRMATDKRLDQSPGDSPLVWAPLHAWRALGQLRAAEAVMPLLNLLEYFDRTDCDSGMEEVPLVLAMIGAPTIRPAGLFLETATRREYARIAASRALEHMGLNQPAHRQACIAELARTLEKWRWNDEGINGFVISALVELRAIEWAGLIRTVFAEGQVDEMIRGGWEEVAADLGVEA